MLLDLADAFTHPIPIILFKCVSEPGEAAGSDALLLQLFQSVVQLVGEGLIWVIPYEPLKLADVMLA